MSERVKIATIVGAGPQFIKAAAFTQADCKCRAEWKSFYGNGRGAEADMRDNNTQPSPTAAR